MVVIKFTYGITKGYSCEKFVLYDSTKRIVLEHDNRAIEEIELRNVLYILVDGVYIWKQEKEMVG